MSIKFPICKMKIPGDLFHNNEDIFNTGELNG